MSNRAVAEATAAVNEALRLANRQAQMKIVRFQRHREGYLHAQVEVNGQLVYVHCRFGSWMIPREPQSPEITAKFPPRANMIEVVPPYTYVLSEQAKRFEDLSRRREKAQNEDQRRREAAEADGVPA